MAKLGFVGLGQMGAPMATNLARWSGGLTVFDLDAGAVAAVVDKGATAAPTLAALAGCEVISIMVRDDAQVRSVVGELLGIVTPGTVLVVHSTVRPETAEDLAAEAAAHAVALLDAPVTGSVIGAIEGTLAMLVGGDEDAFERVREPFALMAGLTVHFGPAGSATRAKLARNLITYTLYSVVGEAQRLAEASGIELQKLAQVVRHSEKVMGGASTVMLRDTAAPIPADHFLRGPMEHARVLGEKDLDLALELGAQLGVPLPFAELTRRRLADELGVPD